MPRSIVVGLLVLILLVTGACNVVTSSSPPSSLDSPDGTAVSSSTASPSPEVVESIQLALSQELNVAADDIVFKQAESVEWGDACLGLPQPNEMCAQVITPGYRIVFTTPQGEWVVHSDSTGATVRWGSPLP